MSDTGLSRQSAAGGRKAASGRKAAGGRKAVGGAAAGGRKAAGGRGPVIGLTGPMCAGKNRVGEILSRRGWFVVDSDPVAHRALEDVKERVFAAFGPTAETRGISLENPDGTVNRRALGSVLFSDPSALALHESIVYPRINELLGEQIDAHPEGIVINAPLLHKSPIVDRCDLVIFVTAWLPIRLFRAIRRDSLPIRQILARFYAQGDLYAQYIGKDVDILRVRNHGSIGALERRLERLLLSKGY